jgi:valyl-tRNA synthetase
MQIDRVYEPQRFEPHWAEWWVESGIFHAVPNSGRHFSLVIPPPNVTGSLHMGHMLDHTLIDLAVRWHRMIGHNTLWVPGTDHAGIATQMVVERKLAEEGLTRVQLGREEFERRVWQWKEIYQKRINDQMKRLGSSCDWSRERFTLDPGLSRAVREAFVRLYEKDLIYRGEYMVNWCPRCNTALSDLEVKYDETQGHLWHIRYPVVGEPGRYVVVATTRPETMLGDTAVAVNAKDARYRDLQGKTVLLPIMDREIPVIVDDLADPEFGTGVVKVTPAHDPNDFAAGKRHNLQFIKVIDESGHMTPAAGKYSGMDRFEARKKVISALEHLGALDRIEPYTVNLSKCDRCGAIVEPLVSTQWFVKTKPLAEPALRAVDDGRIEFIPPGWIKTYHEWMDNIRDWCISRQLWWGHRIPAWHCHGCGRITVAREDPSACRHCGSAEIHQETDVLDTWFSSGLWPFSTLGWPDQTADLTAFYPTSLMVTGFDILFFWVARMIMLGIEMTGQVPFRQVHLHGLVRDAERQKMSKTKGNVIDPLTVNDQYGTDAVRLSLVMGAASGMDIALTPERFESSRNFANKIWNAARFVFMKMEAAGVEPWLTEENDCCVPETMADSLAAPLEDRWIFSRLNTCSDTVNRATGQHRYHEVADTLYHFFWDEFCDWYIELKKPKLAEGGGLDGHWRNLLTVFELSLRLLHPVMPFLTEELWQRLAANSPRRPQSIALAHFPQYNQAASDLRAEKEMATMQAMIVAARAIRADHGIDKKLPLPATIYARGGAFDVAAMDREAIERLATIELELREGAAPKLRGAVRSTPEFDLILHLPKADTEALRGRLTKEIVGLEKLVANSERQLQNEQFMSKAPAKVVTELRSKLADYQSQLAKSRATVEELDSDH